jgi:hypothetical protein
MDCRSGGKPLNYSLGGSSGTPYPRCLHAPTQQPAKPPSSSKARCVTVVVAVWDSMPMYNKAITHICTFNSSNTDKALRWSLKKDTVHHSINIEIEWIVSYKHHGKYNHINNIPQLNYECVRKVLKIIL